MLLYFRKSAYYLVIYCYAECSNAECRYAECHYAVCHGARGSTFFYAGLFAVAVSYTIEMVIALEGYSQNLKQKY